MKNRILLTLVCSLFCSCSQINSLIDEQGKEDLNVCVGAVLVSTSIRQNEAKLAAYQKASDTIASILKNENNSITRAQLEATIREVLGNLFPSFMVDLVIDDILDVYDENIEKIQSDEKLIIALESTKASIDSGIQLAIKTGRPVMILPKE